MNIIYISPTEFPSKAAHTVHIIKMCEAFGKNGHQILLVCPSSKQKISAKEIYNFYDVEPVFKIKFFNYLNVKGQRVINPVRIALWLLFQKKDIIISRDINSAMYVTFFGMKIIYDAHDIPTEKSNNKKRLRSFLTSKYLKKLTVVSTKMKEIFIERGVDPNKIFIIRNGANEPKDHSTIENIITNGVFNVGYIGHLYPGKGMEVISSVAPLLTNTIIHVVGGDEKDIIYWKEKTNSNNIVFHGFIPQSNLAAYINSFDACLLPNQKSVFGVGRKRDIGEITCPLKMFDYMAYSKPIIASDLPILKEVLDDSMAIFCDPENPQVWADAIEKLKADNSLKIKIATNAHDVFLNNYTWQKRAEKIIA